MLHNYTWLNSKISFDNVGIAYLALFQVVSLLISFENFSEITTYFVFLFFFFFY